MFTAHNMYQRIEQGKRILSSEEGTETVLCYVSIFVKCVYGWSGHGSESEFIGSRSGAAGSELA